MILKLVLLILALLFLAYLLWPLPGSINEFPALPNSEKSNLEGDTIQIPNVSAYFSDNYREFVTNFYKQFFLEKQSSAFVPISLNHPPEYAFTAIKVQTESTYLEEYIYPLKGSIFINGMEPFEDGKPRYMGAIPFEVDNNFIKQKVTLRYYPSPLWIRLTVWLGLIILMYSSYILTKGYLRMLDLTIVILSFNTKQLTLQCLESLFQQKLQTKFQTIVVDNGSVDGSQEAIKKHFPKVMLIDSQTNLGFTKGNNLGFKKSHSKYTLFLNSDTKILDDSIDKLLETAKENNFDIMSCQLLNSNGSFQPNAGELPSPAALFLWLSGLDDILGINSSYQARSKDYYQDGKEVGWVSGAVMLVNSESFKKINGFDENIFMYGEDVELCLRAHRKGLKIGWTDQSKIIHLGGKSSSNPKFRQWLGEFKGLLYIYKKFYGIPAVIILRIFFYIFIGLRIIAFNLVGKFNFAKTYVQVAISL